MIRHCFLAIVMVAALSNIAYAEEANAVKPGPMPDNDKSDRAFSTAVDPVTSVPSLAFAPGIASPSLDVLAASLVAAKEGTSIRGVFAPFAFTENVPIIIADTRVEIRGQSDSAKPWGMSLSTGYNSRTTKLREKLDHATVRAIEAKCEKNIESPKFAAFKQEVKKFAEMVNPLLPEKERIDIEKMAAKDAAAASTVAWYRFEDPQKLLTAQQKSDIQSQADKVGDLKADVIDTPMGDCVYKAYAREQATRAYSQGWSARVEGNFDAFPYVEGPKIRADETKPYEAPVKHMFSGYGVGASISWFPGRDSRLSLSGSYSAKRAKPDVENLQSRLTVLLETALNKGFGDIAPNGFQKGIAGGFQFGLQYCLEDGGCEDPVPYYDKSKTSRAMFVGAFLDLRPDEKLQLRLGVPLTIYTFATPPANTDGGSLAWSFSPTVSLTTTKWVL